MLRSRSACLALAVVLGLLAGCTCFRYPLFGRRSSADCDCGTAGAISSDGAVFDGAASGLPGVSESVIVNPPSSAVPPLAPAPRLVPQAQAPIAPYVPR
jgi:hypothetical protein